MNGSLVIESYEVLFSKAETRLDMLYSKPFFQDMEWYFDRLKGLSQGLMKLCDLDVIGLRIDQGYLRCLGQSAQRDN